MSCLGINARGYYILLSLVFVMKFEKPKKYKSSQYDTFYFHDTIVTQKDITLNFAYLIMKIEIKISVS